MSVGGARLHWVLPDKSDCKVLQPPPPPPPPSSPPSPLGVKLNARAVIWLVYIKTCLECNSLLTNEALSEPRTDESPWWHTLTCCLSLPPPTPVSVRPFSCLCACFLTLTSPSVSPSPHPQNSTKVSRIIYCLYSNLCTVNCLSVADCVVRAVLKSFVGSTNQDSGLTEVRFVRWLAVESHSKLFKYWRLRVMARPTYQPRASVLDGNLGMRLNNQLVKLKP